jgi:ActR/RegA family two-component response regulator
MRQRSILLVDDDIEFLEVLQRRFERRGFCVLACDSQRGALETAQRAMVDVAIIDRTLNGECGLELVYRLKEVHPALSIVMLTGRSARDDMDLAMRTGVQRYLCKPCSLAEIEAAVADVITQLSDLGVDQEVIHDTARLKSR